MMAKISHQIQTRSSPTVIDEHVESTTAALQMRQQTIRQGIFGQYLTTLFLRGQSFSEAFPHIFKNIYETFRATTLCDLANSPHPVTSAWPCAFTCDLQKETLEPLLTSYNLHSPPKPKQNTVS